MKRTKTVLYPYQKLGVWKIHKGKGRVIEADEMSLGKTIQAMFYAKVFLDGGPYVVVTPATIKWQWLSEIAEKIGMMAEVLGKHTPPKDLIHRMTHKNCRNTWFIVNYEVLGHPKSAKRTWAQLLQNIRPNLLIGDEAHYLCNPRAARTRNFKALSLDIPHVLLLTGTPISNSPSELWSLLNICRPEMFPHELRFLNRYCKREVTRFGVKFTGAVRTEELHNILKDSKVLIRRLTGDVYKDLPAKKREIVHVELSDYKEYQLAEKDLIAWLRKTAPHRARRARNAERMVRIAYLRQLVGRLKMKVIEDWIDAFRRNTDKKLLVFGVHKNVLRPLHEKYLKRSIRVDGSITGIKRHRAIERFKTDKKIDLAFMNIKAGGTGWNGKGISRSLFTEMALTPTAHNQAEKRTHGPGRGEPKSPSIATYLIARGTIDEKLIQKVQDKQSVSDQIIDGKATADGFNVADMLEEYLLKKGRKK